MPLKHWSDDQTTNILKHNFKNTHTLSRRKTRDTTECKLTWCERWKEVQQIDSSHVAIQPPLKTLAQPQ